MHYAALRALDADSVGRPRAVGRQKHPTGRLPAAASMTAVRGKTRGHSPAWRVAAGNDPPPVPPRWQAAHPRHTAPPHLVVDTAGRRCFAPLGAPRAPRRPAARGGGVKVAGSARRVGVDPRTRRRGGPLLHPWHGGGNVDGLKAAGTNTPYTLSRCKPLRGVCGIGPPGGCGLTLRRSVGHASTRRWNPALSQETVLATTARRPWPTSPEGMVHRGHQRHDAAATAQRGEGGDRCHGSKDGTRHRKRWHVGLLFLCRIPDSQPPLDATATPRRPPCPDSASPPRTAAVVSKRPAAAHFLPVGRLVSSRSVPWCDRTVNKRSTQSSRSVWYWWGWGTTIWQHHCCRTNGASQSPARTAVSPCHTLFASAPAPHPAAPPAAPLAHYPRSGGQRTAPCRVPCALWTTARVVPRGRVMEPAAQESQTARRPSPPPIDPACESKNTH